jgi:hypothetical protein
MFVCEIFVLKLFHTRIIHTNLCEIFFCEFFFTQKNWNVYGKKFEKLYRDVLVLTELKILRRYSRLSAKA